MIRGELVFEVSIREVEFEVVHTPNGPVLRVYSILQPDTADQQPSRDNPAVPLSGPIRGEASEADSEPGYVRVGFNNPVTQPASEPAAPAATPSPQATLGADRPPSEGRNGVSLDRLQRAYHAGFEGGAKVRGEIGCVSAIPLLIPKLSPRIYVILHSAPAPAGRPYPQLGAGVPGEIGVAAGFTRTYGTCVPYIRGTSSAASRHFAIHNLAVFAAFASVSEGEEYWRGSGRELSELVELPPLPANW